MNENFLDCMFELAMYLLGSKHKYWTEVEPGIWRELYAAESDTYGDTLIIKYIPNREKRRARAEDDGVFYDEEDEPEKSTMTVIDLIAMLSLGDLTERVTVEKGKEGLKAVHLQ